MTDNPTEEEHYLLVAIDNMDLLRIHFGLRGGKSPIQVSENIRHPQRMIGMYN